MFCPLMSTRITRQTTWRALHRNMGVALLRYPENVQGEATSSDDKQQQDDDSNALVTYNLSVCNSVAHALSVSPATVETFDDA